MTVRDALALGLVLLFVVVVAVSAQSTRYTYDITAPRLAGLEAATAAANAVRGAKVVTPLAYWTARVDSMLDDYVRLHVTDPKLGTIVDKLQKADATTLAAIEAILAQ